MVEFVWVEKLGESEVEEGIGESIEAGPTERSDDRSPPTNLVAPAI
jgi:hypothetical protein